MLPSCIEHISPCPSWPYFICNIVQRSLCLLLLQLVPLCWTTCSTPQSKLLFGVASYHPILQFLHVFSLPRETEPNWVQELEADIKDECSQYGQILHVNVNDDSLVCLHVTRDFLDSEIPLLTKYVLLQGEVFLKFESVPAGEQAVKALNGRWFGGKQASSVTVYAALTLCVSNLLFQ